MVTIAVTVMGCQSATKRPSSVSADHDSPLEIKLPPQPDSAWVISAIKAMDAGDPKTGASILEEVRTRHPENGVVLHELALAHRLAHEPGRAVEILMPFRHRLPASLLANLGSALDEAGRRADAEQVLREALKQYPQAGLLHAELGTVLVNQGKTQEAIDFYQQGTHVEPSVPANHLHLARLMADTNSRGLTLIFGETFRLLEPGSVRSREIAKLMVTVCQNAVQLTEQSKERVEAKISLAPDTIYMHVDQIPRLPLAHAFELVFSPGLAIAHLDGLSLASLHRARVGFVDLMNQMESAFDWNSVPVFRWIRQVSAAGHLEAYDYWLFGPAFPEEMERWQEAHKPEVEAMRHYVANHPPFSAEPAK
jgi:tetratricopeptide (TPR) repeat protein